MPARNLRQYGVSSLASAAMNASAETVVTYRKFMCVVCGFIYDEEAGLPEEGIEPGTRWEDIPDTWFCPVCGARKRDFSPYED